MGPREVNAVLAAFKRTMSITPKQVREVISAYYRHVAGCLSPEGVGVYAEPGFVKFVVKEKPKRVQEAIKPGPLVFNRFTQKEEKHQGRPRKVIPAKNVCKAKALRALQDIVVG